MGAAVSAVVGMKERRCIGPLPCICTVSIAMYMYNSSKSNKQIKKGISNAVKNTTVPPAYYRPFSSGYLSFDNLFALVLAVSCFGGPEH